MPGIFTPVFIVLVSIAPLAKPRAKPGHFSEDIKKAPVGAFTGGISNRIFSKPDSASQTSKLYEPNF